MCFGICVSWCKTKKCFHQSRTDAPVQSDIFIGSAAQRKKKSIIQKQLSHRFTELALVNTLYLKAPHWKSIPLTPFVTFWFNFEISVYPSFIIDLLKITWPCIGFLRLEGLPPVYLHDASIARVPQIGREQHLGHADADLIWPWAESHP